jgi:hypothetical protein
MPVGKAQNPNNKNQINIKSQGPKKFQVLILRRMARAGYSKFALNFGAYL